MAGCSAALLLGMPPVAAQTAAEVRVQTALQEVRLALVRQGQIGANTAAAVLAARSTDIDGDGTLEPPIMRSSAQGPAGGGWLPTGTAGGTLDGYGTEYGYCAFNNGSSRAASTGLLAGDPAGGLLLAVIFAGPDRTFQTSCAGLKAGGAAQGDDYVATMSTAQTNLGAGIHFARPPVLNDAALSALSAANSGDLLDGELRLVRDTNTLWRWNASTNAFVRVDMPQVSALQVNGNLEATGPTTLNGGLTVTGGVVQMNMLNVGDALTVSGATTLKQGLSSTGGDVKLNTSGNRSTEIGNASSKTTITGDVSINTTGSRRTDIGNSSSGLYIGSPTNFEQGFTTKGGNVNINVSRALDGTIFRTTIGDRGGINLTPIEMNGSTTFNADVTVLGVFDLTGSTTINRMGRSNTEVGNPSSTTSFLGPVNFSFGPTMPSITGVNGLTLSAGSTEGFIAVNSASQFNSLITANGGVATTSLLVNPLANNPPAQVGINTATPAYALDVVGDINASGLVRANGVQLTSDARFKTRIAPLTTALQTLERIEGVAFDWNRAAFPERKFPATRQFGVIAQQVETVLPELVATDAQGYKSVNYIGFVPLLIEGLKAQQGQLQQQASKLAGHDKLLASLGLRMDAAEARLGKADEALARLAKRADGFERLAQHFSQPADDTLRVEAPRLVASNFTADRIAVETLVAQRLEAEQLKVRKLEADELRVTGDLQARRLVAERVSTGEKELFVSLGTVAPLFEVPEGAHFAVTLSSNDGSYATATVLKAGGALRLVPTSSQGIELVPLGGAVGVMAPSKKVKASWLRTG